MHLQASLDDTIVATATPPGVGAVAVVRLAGPEAFALARAVAGELPVSHRAGLRVLRSEAGATLDQALVLPFAGPRSYCGDDTVEFHTHGSPAVVALLHDELVRLGARRAGPGEFTLRAFMQGKLDLAQAEAVRDLIASCNEREVEAAQRRLGGQLSARVKALLDPLEGVLTGWRAALDFPEYPTDSGAERGSREVVEEIRSKLQVIASSLRVERSGRRSLVLCGAPNAGKSTLMNAWVGEERALVHEQPGTTRDPIEVPLEDGAMRISLWDTAGLREAPESVEAGGVRLAQKRINDADLALWLVAADSPAWPEPGFVGKVVLSKIDLADADARSSLRRECERRGLALLGEVSALDGSGVATLATAATSVTDGGNADDGALVVRERHAECLDQAHRSLAALSAGWDDGATLDVLTVELEEACGALGRLLGRDVDAEVLDRIFSDFCIGK